MTNEIVTIQPGELTFLFELKKQSSCSLQLVNNTNCPVAFKVKSTAQKEYILQPNTGKKYFVEPSTGVIPPQSTYVVTVTMLAQKEIPPDMQCKDKFCVQSVVVSTGKTAKNITPDMFNEASAKVEKHKLRVVYVSPVQTNSPEPQPLEDGSAPEESVDNQSQSVSSVDNSIDAEDLKYVPHNAVVKVFCTHTEPDYCLPWQKQRAYHSKGSAFMIEGRMLLTNAHCVAYHTQVTVKRSGDNTIYVAKVLAEGVECDIALLSVESEGFWEGTKPLRFGRLPCLQDAVTVEGYPIGGDTISVTNGVVSRIEVITYFHGGADLLGIQICAPINPGNSGGPVFNDRGECIGIAFQVDRSAGAENIGYVIPEAVVRHFLNDYHRYGKCRGFPCLGVLHQKLENPALRACLNVTANEGVLIRAVERTSPAKKVLMKGDVLVSIDGVAVANDGTVPFRSRQRIAFGYRISKKYMGEKAKFGIIREGEKRDVEIKLKPCVPLVPYHIEGRQPSYLIVAGLVFTPLSMSLKDNECEESMRLELMAKARYPPPKFGREQMVMLSQVLASGVNIGYQVMSNKQVLKLNNIKIKNMVHLAKTVDSCNDKYLTFELEDNFRVVMERQAASAATPQVLKDYGIAWERSPDLCSPMSIRQKLLMK